MEKNAKLRILSKIGFLLVFIGFFQPISCNLNGFQLAKSLETFGGPNILSISLYIIFISSCIGILLLILLLMKMDYNSKYDWIVAWAVIIPFTVFVYLSSRNQEESIFSFLFRFQSGAYIIFVGIIIAMGSLLFINKELEKNIVTSTSNISQAPNIDNSEYLLSNEAIHLKKEIILKDLNNELNLILKKGSLETDEKKKMLISYTSELDAIKLYCKKTGESYISGKIYIEKLKYFKQNLSATEEQWEEYSLTQRGNWEKSNKNLNRYLLVSLIILVVLILSIFTNASIVVSLICLMLCMLFSLIYIRNSKKYK